MKRAIAVVLAASLAVAALQVLPSFAATRSVTVGDNFFKPATLTVAKGTTVRWVWKGSSLHNVTRSRGPAFKRCGNRTSGSCSRTLRRAGTYRLLCTIHGFRMKVVVR
jgi:plastocyanin